MKKLLYSYVAKNVVFYEFCNNVAKVQNFRGEVKFFSNYFRKNKSTYSVIHLLLLTSVFWKNLKQEFYYIYYIYNIYSNYNY